MYVSLLNKSFIFGIDPMNGCIRYSIARHFVQPSRRAFSFPPNRSFTNASIKMDPVTTGLNSVPPTTNGENKPELRFVDVRQMPPPTLYSTLTQRQADRHQPL